MIGVVIAYPGVVRWTVARRRSRLMAQLTAGAAFVGALPLLGMALLNLIVVLGSTTFGNATGFLLVAIWQAVYAGLVTSTIYFRLSGIQV